MASLYGVLDQYDDGGAYLLQCLQEGGSAEPPAVVKTAVDMRKVAHVREDDYAVVMDTQIGRLYKYPIADAGNTAVSALYFGETSSKLPLDVAHAGAIKLAAALEEFGLPGVEAMQKVADIQVPTMDPAAEDAALRSLFGLHDDEVTVLEDAFKGLSPRGKRRLMFEVKTAGVIDLEKLPDDLITYTRGDLGDMFPGAVQLRRQLVVGIEDADKELTALLEKRASADTLADELSRIDEKYGLTSQYYRMIPDPWQSVFGQTQVKTANAVCEIGGREFGAHDIVGWLEAGGRAQLEDAFGGELSTQLSKDPVAVLASLPATHKQAIARMINE